MSETGKEYQIIGVRVQEGPMSSAANTLKWLAFILLGIYGAFWIFLLATEIPKVGLIVLLYFAILILVTIGLLWLTSKQPLISGILMILLGLMITCLFSGIMFGSSFSINGFMDLMMYVPLPLAGILSLASYLIQPRKKSKEITQNQNIDDQTPRG